MCSFTQTPLRASGTNLSNSLAGTAESLFLITGSSAGLSLKLKMYFVSHSNCISSSSSPGSGDQNWPLALVLGACRLGLPCDQRPYGVRIHPGREQALPGSSSCSHGAFPGLQGSLATWPGVVTSESDTGLPDPRGRPSAVGPCRCQTPPSPGPPGVTHAGTVLLRGGVGGAACGRGPVVERVVQGP